MKLGPGVYLDAGGIYRNMAATSKMSKAEERKALEKIVGEGAEKMSEKDLAEKARIIAKEKNL